MNLYMLVEGRRTEKMVYRKWITHLFPNLREANTIEDVSTDNFFIISGNGYPSYVRRINAALQDMRNSGKFDHLIVCVDAEDVSLQVRLKEIDTIVSGGPIPKAYFVIVHDCCIETWFLGNSKMMRRNPETQRLRQWKDFFDVSENDPELLPCHAAYSSRAQFHHDYLQDMFRERDLSYSKNHPGPVLDRTYFQAIVERSSRTGHLFSFRRLLGFLNSLGASI